MRLSYEELDAVFPVRSILDSMGIQKLKDRGDYFHFSSPLREDKNPSMALYKSNLFCIDFAGYFKGSLFKLYTEVTGNNFFNEFGINKIKFLNNLYDRKNLYRREAVGRLELSDYQMYFFGGALNYNVYDFPEVKEYLESRFITKEFAEHFHIAYTHETKIIRGTKRHDLDTLMDMATTFRERICIPIYYKDYLVSIEGRNASGEYPKVIYPKGGSVSNLFNYNNLKKDEPLVVVEGIMDMPRIWQHVTKNVTTVFGIQMTRNQREQLKEFDVILFPDNDESGRIMVDLFDQSQDRPYKVTFLPSGDPGDEFNSIEDIRYAIENAVDDTSYFLNNSGLFEDKKLSDQMFWDFSP